MKTDGFFKAQKKYKVNPFYLRYFINEFWFIPSDILQRGMEANIWHLCKFKSPILEIGTGDGTISNFLLKNQPQIDMGIDIEEAGLDTARNIEISKGKKRYKQVLCANAEKMPFKDASFKTIISNSTFEHITKDTFAVREVGRVLKKGGLFYITIPSEYLQKWILEEEEKNNNEKAKEKLEAFNKRAVHLHYHPLDVWEQYLKKGGMEIIFYKYYFPKNVALYWYKLFKLFTATFRNKEMWSYVGHSKVTKLLPKQMIKHLLQNKILKKAYNEGFLINSDEPGGQMFIVARKI